MPVQDLDSRILNRDQEKQASRKLRQSRQQSKPDKSTDRVASLASGGFGGNTGETDKEKQNKKKDKLGRPVRPTRPMPSGQKQGSSTDSAGSPQQSSGPSNTAGRQAEQDPSTSSGQDSSGFDSRLARVSGKGGEKEDQESGERAEQGGNKNKEVKEGKRQERKSANEDENQEPTSLRQKLAKAKQAANLKKIAKDKLEKSITAPANEGTKWLLRWAWGSLIPSCGLSLLYIDLHFFLSTVLGKSLFCKLGEEWIPKKIMEVGGKKAGEKFTFGEIIIVGFLNLLALIVFLIVVAVFLLIMDIVENPLSYIGKIVVESFKSIIGK